MSKLKAIIICITLIFLILLISGFIWFRGVFLEFKSLGAVIPRIEYTIESYIQQNQGEFPSSEEDLLRQHYFKKVKTPDGYDYFRIRDPQKPSSSGPWSKYYFNQFSQFKFAYGTKFEDIVADNGKLYDKSTGTQILLISGPDNILNLNYYYETTTFRWYEKMLEVKNKESQETNTITTK